MAEQFYSILTNIGKSKIANVTALGTKLNLVSFVVGDSNGKYYNPNETQKNLVNEVWRGNINHINIHKENSNWIEIEAVIPSNIGGFMIREAGILDDKGNLIAVAKYPETYKPVVSQGSAKDLIIKLILEVSNTATVNLKLDPTVVIATKKDIDEVNTKIYTHEKNTNIHITKEEKEKLAEIEEGATKYIHPATHLASMIVEDSSKRFVTDTEKNTWNNKLDKTAYTAQDVLNKIKTVDGAGSGLDADYLRGKSVNTLLEEAKGMRFAKGSYIGTGKEIREIIVGFKPKIVEIYFADLDGGKHKIKILSDAPEDFFIYYYSPRIFGTNVKDTHNVILTSSGFKVGDTDIDYGPYGNRTRVTYLYLAYA